MHRTRIKICGLTRAQDVQAAVAAGADAIGFVFYDKSPRYLAPADAGRLIASVPPFITTTGLFVNATQDEVSAVLQQAPVSLLQFHGDETVETCVAIAQAVNRPFIRAVRVKPETTARDLVEYEAEYRAASGLFAGLLLDAFAEGYGGSGKVFDWSLIPESIAPRVVLSGGLSVQNATDAVRRVRPYAVDISSGVEAAKGIKDAEKIRAFISAVRAADAA
ncbi:phosphoribosylanthranilate isomerase [Oxalicibacterium faecigallinarum]|uniref:N-(5'-phosphoribosyl)anthranilate isomerase n=1 Tax=Oxalicibacterium faecigallinarum TaxID=573741 RepID=A0A8J3ALY0_9BURK|nr:phosphoribosylanthranilate isomerase [Oxalicibacterium faecigallinarum]GGI16094.1 N-(5'-phosphoribosyl)anthranilate isomerase [Oxalicibacterium faecigallinarum]